MAEVKWIKITTNIFDDEKIKLIESMPDRDAILIIWIKLLAQAGKCNMSGHLLLNQNIPYTDEMLSTIFNRPLSTVRLALDVFSKFGMVELADNAFCISNWEKHQNIEGMDKIREQNRIRKQRQRLNQKQVLLPNNCDSHVTVTQSHAIDIDIDIELDLEKEKRSKIKTIGEQVTERIFEYTQNESLREALEQFVEYRKAIKKPIKSLYTINLLLKELDKYPDKLAVVNQSIANGWQGLFPIKESTQQRGKVPSTNPFKKLLEEGAFDE